MPADIVQSIFKALHLSVEEKKQVLPYLKANVVNTISTIREFISNRFHEFEAMINTLEPAPKQKPEFKPPHSLEITAGAAITDGSGQGAGRGARGAGSGRGGYGHRGKNKGPDKVNSLEGNTGAFPPEKKKICEKAISVPILHGQEKACHALADNLSLDHCSQQV